MIDDVKTSYFPRVAEELMYLTKVVMRKGVLTRKTCFSVCLAAITIGFANAQQPFIYNEKTYIDNAIDGAFAVEVVDLDLDSDKDIVVSSDYGDAIYWFENDGSQAFTKKVIASFIDSPKSIVILDIDQDGDLDVASASYNDDAIRWYENDGNQIFSSHTVSTLADGAYSVFAADLDGDGDIDLGASSIRDDDLVWFENDGNQVFTERVISYSHSNPYYATAFDLNQDGNQDIITVWGNYIFWYQWNGSTWTYQIIGNVSSVREIEIVDIDKDGDYDLLAGSANQFEYIRLLINDGSQNFSSNPIGGGQRSYAIETGDFDLDGDIDIAAGNSSNNNLYWYSNHTFWLSTTVAYVGQPYGLSAADIDQDGDIDLISCSTSGDDVIWHVNHMDPTPEADILTFSLPNQLSSTIDQSAKTITVDFSDTTLISDLVATFTLSDTAVAYVNGQEQISAVSAHDFSVPITYTVYAADSSIINDYLVTANVLNSETDILAFGLPGELQPLSIDTVTKRVTGVVSSTSEDLIASFSISTGATASIQGQLQQSGVTTNNFSMPLTYRVTAEDGVTNLHWIIDIEVLSPETEITSFSLPNSIWPAAIDNVNHQINLSFSDLVDRSSMTATFDISSGASAQIGSQLQQSGVTINDFTENVIYTILAEDSVTSQDWLIDVETRSSSTSCNFFRIPGALRSGRIDTTNHTIEVDFSNTSDVSNLVPQFQFALGATVTISGEEQTSGVSKNSFESPLNYLVTASDQSTTQIWTVQVNKISLCDQLEGFGLKCDTTQSQLSIDSLLLGTGLEWINGKISVKGYDSLDHSYRERASQVAGNGLDWNGTALSVDPGNLIGNGFDWNNNTIDFDATDIAGAGLEWDSVAQEIRLKNGHASLFTKVNDSLIYLSNPPNHEIKLGVGTSYVPANFMLAVAGLFYADQVKVRSSDQWPDYVFDDQYQLMTLQELQDFIDQHGHLPDLPSEHDVANYGFDSGKMITILLKKLEELTLYTIEQDIRLKKYSKEIEDLEISSHELLDEFEQLSKARKK